MVKIKLPNQSTCNVIEGSYCCCKTWVTFPCSQKTTMWRSHWVLSTPAHLIFPTSAVVCCPHTPNSFIWHQSLGHFEADIFYSSFIPHVTHGLSSAYLSTNTAIIIILKVRLTYLLIMYFSLFLCYYMYVRSCKFHDT